MTQYTDTQGNVWNINHDEFGWYADDFAYIEDSYELLCSAIEYWLHY